MARFWAKHLLKKNCVLWLSLQLLFETLPILRRNREIIINVRRSSCKVPVIIVKFNETLIFWQIFEKYTNIQLHENPFTGSRVVTCGQTETDMKKLGVAFHNFANATTKNAKHSLPLAWREETSHCYKTHVWNEVGRGGEWGSDRYAHHGEKILPAPTGNWTSVTQLVARHSCFWNCNHNFEPSSTLSSN